MGPDIYYGTRHLSWDIMGPDIYHGTQIYFLSWDPNLFSIMDPNLFSIMGPNLFSIMGPKSIFRLGSTSLELVRISRTTDCVLRIPSLPYGVSSELSSDNRVFQRRGIK